MIAVATLFPSGDDDVGSQATNGEPRGVDTSEWAKTDNKVSKQSRVPLAGRTDRKGSGWDNGQFSLLRQADGHFYADGAIQNAPTRFLVDTGASIIALTGADAQAAGLSWSDADISPIGTGASGVVYGVPTILAEVEIGGLTQRNVRAVIIPEGLEVSLLGQSFLSQISSVEIAQDRMIWKDN